MVRKYGNILEGPCSSKKCTACQIQNSLVRTNKLTLRGLCKYSFFDTTYVIKYSPDTIISYVGLERTIISYNFTESLWTMRDVTNPDVLAVTKADFRSLAIGNINWTITNDYLCGEGSKSVSYILVKTLGPRLPEKDALPPLVSQQPVHL